jgi:phosphatidylserine/phosphatidylglycerophosphate/cardiolipin synthase-like enzyme
MRSHRIEAVSVEKVHSKIVIGDDNVYCVGSFNWFSANRLRGRHETSLVYRGPDLIEEIDIMKKSLQSRVISGTAVVPETWAGSKNRIHTVALQ